jgi:hypothetical protein
MLIAGVGDLTKFCVGIVNLLRLGVKTGRFNISVIDSIFFTSSNSKFEIQKKVNLCHTLKVFLADGNVLLKRLLGKINHVRREEWLSVRLIL